MKNFLSTTVLAASMALAGFSVTSVSHAQTNDSKLDWAAKVVALQQGPELDRLVEQLTASTTQELLQNWGPKVEASPVAKQPEIRTAMNAELKKYSDDISTSINSKVAKVSTESLVPAYAERFTLDELKQLAAFFESPTIKKYQAAAPELGNVFVQKLVDASRPDVSARIERFNITAAKIVGSNPASSSKPVPAPKAPAKQ